MLSPDVGSQDSQILFFALLFATNKVPDVTSESGNLFQQSAAIIAEAEQGISARLRRH